MPAMALLLATAGLAAGPQGEPFSLLHDYTGEKFFDGFAFFSAGDPTGGTVDFVDKPTALSEGLAGVNDAGQVFMRADNSTKNPTGSGRKSVRVTSTARLDPKDLKLEPGDTGAILLVLDLTHMPTGCATWPAFWMNAAVGAWPTYGEIDIIEGVHTQNATVTTLHTGHGCDQDAPIAGPPPVPMSGKWASVDGKPATDCYIHAHADANNMGCQIKSPPDGGSMGAPFNAGGGGVYAFLWTDRAAPPRSYACAANGMCGVAAAGAPPAHTFNNSECDNTCKPPAPPPPTPPSPPGPPATGCVAPRQGFDLDGTNGPGVQAKTAVDCCPLCLADKGCDGYTYFQGTCYLKHGAMKYLPSAGRVSALTKANATASPDAYATRSSLGHAGNDSCAVLANTDISGKNLGYDGPGKKPTDCCSLCEAFAGCKASVHFEYGPTGGGGGYCYYKAGDVEVPKKTGSTAFVPGKPQPPPPPPPAPTVSDYSQRIACM